MDTVILTTLVEGAITLPSEAGRLHIVEGTAWFSQDQQDAVLSAGDTIALDKDKKAVIGLLKRYGPVTYKITN